MRMNKEINQLSVPRLHYIPDTRIGFVTARKHTKHIRYNFVSIVRSESAASVHVIRLASSFTVLKPYTDYNKILSL
jgi:hypothetical protein